MKTLKSLLYVVVAAFTLASCADDLEYTPAAPESGYGVHFDADAAGVIEVELDSESFTVPVYRSKAGEAVTIMIANTQAEEGMFDIPNSVTFEADKTVAELVITYDFEDFEPDVEYGIALAINDDENITEYGPSEYVFDVVYPSPYVLIGTGYYTEDMFASQYSSFAVETWQVDIYENEVTEGIFRISNPYYNVNCPYFGLTEDDLAGMGIEPLTTYIEIVATDPDRVYLPTQSMQIDVGYGEVFFSSMAGYYLANGDAETAEEYYGTYDVEKGTITFPVGSLLFAETGYNNGSLYPSNNSGKFRVLMPGFANVDPQITAVENKGTFIDKDGNYYGMFTATPNKDALKFKYAAVQGVGIDVAAAAAAILDGTAANVGEGEFVKAKPADFNALVTESGNYTLVVVPLNGETAGEPASVVFQISVGGGEELPTHSVEEFYGTYVLAGQYTQNLETTAPIGWDGVVISEFPTPEGYTGTYAQITGLLPFNFTIGTTDAIIATYDELTHGLIIGTPYFGDAGTTMYTDNTQTTTADYRYYFQPLDYANLAYADQVMLTFDEEGVIHFGKSYLSEVPDRTPTGYATGVENVEDPQDYGSVIFMFDLTLTPSTGEAPAPAPASVKSWRKVAPKYASFLNF